MTQNESLSGFRRLWWTAYSTVFWLFVAVSSILLFPVALLIWLLTAPFDPRKRLLHLFTCFWASLYSWLNPVWRVRVEGRERLPGDRPTVFVANHRSLVDILVLFRTFADFKWVSKIEIFRIPVIGWNMRLNDYIPIDRGNRDSARAMMRQCEEALGRGSPIMMFPEGTRSMDGRLRPFKPGAFELALRTGCPIQPILIEGSGAALPKHGLVLRGRHPITITILDPLEPEAFAGRDPETLAAHVQDLFAAELAARSHPARPRERS